MVGAGVPTGAGVAAPDVPAGQAKSQVDPVVTAGGEAVLAAVGLVNDATALTAYKVALAAATGAAMSGCSRSAATTSRRTRWPRRR